MRPSARARPSTSAASPSSAISPPDVPVVRVRYDAARRAHVSQPAATAAPKTPTRGSARPSAALRASPATPKRAAAAAAAAAARRPAFSAAAAVAPPVGGASPSHFSSDSGIFETPPALRAQRARNAALVSALSRRIDESLARGGAGAATTDAPRGAPAALFALASPDFSPFLVAHSGRLQFGPTQDDGANATGGGAATQLRAEPVSAAVAAGAPRRVVSVSRDSAAQTDDATEHPPAPVPTMPAREPSVRSAPVPPLTGAPPAPVPNERPPVRRTPPPLPLGPSIVPSAAAVAAALLDGVDISAPQPVDSPQRLWKAWRATAGARGEHAQFAGRNDDARSGDENNANDDDDDDEASERLLMEALRAASASCSGDAGRRLEAGWGAPTHCF